MANSGVPKKLYEYLLKKLDYNIKILHIIATALIKIKNLKAAC